jgi:site-specific DNA recombinase
VRGHPHGYHSTPTRRTPRPAPDPKLGVRYLRISTGPQAAHGHGLETQEREGRALAAREGSTIVDVITDVDSGTVFDLAGVHRLLDLAEAGAVGTAIVYDPDRLSRSLSKYVWLDGQLTAAGVVAHYVTVGRATSEEENAFHEIQAVFSQMDHRRIVRRLASGKHDKAAGQIAGVGEAPEGYHYVLNERGKQYQLAVDAARSGSPRWGTRI